MVYSILLITLSVLSFSFASRQDPQINGYGWETHLIAKQSNFVFPWTFHTFTNVGYHTNVTVNVPPSTLFCLQVTDLYCTGDEFSVYYAGTFAFNTSVVNTVNCTTPFLDPEVAFVSPGISHGQGLLISSALLSQNATIIPTKSPYSGGILAARPVLGLCPVF